MSPRGIMMQAWRAISCAIVLQSTITYAIELDLSSTDSIKSAASIVAYDMMQYYTGNETGGTPGLLPANYYWWEGGAMWGALIDYYYYTGDSTYNNVTTEALLFQVGTQNDYEPRNQSFDLGNDDQAFWAFAALSAAELNFPNPPADQPQWLALAQAVFNRQASRWDLATCNGGLRWQIFAFNGGYDYKNAISNGAFFQIAARLGKYTGNTTYNEWAEKIWDWSDEIGLIDARYNVFDGTSVGNNCTTIDHLQWSYNVGVYLLGAATMWNMTQTTTWQTRTQGLLNATHVFFTNNTGNTTEHIMWEVECEPTELCNSDQLSFKAYLSRWMAASTKVAPWCYDFVIARLNPSAQAAAATCTGSFNGAAGTSCGMKWTIEANDGSYGVGQQMDALEVILGNMISEVTSPVTSNSGGTSQGDVSAGTGSGSSVTDVSGSYYDITTGDKAGAGVLTAVVALITLCSAAWSIW